MNIEIKKKENDKYFIIIYNNNGSSQGNILSKNDLYDLYIQLRELFKKENIN
jgi:hypothetical protein